MSAYRETKLHGTHGFPYIVYLGIIPEYTGGVALHWHEEMEIIYVTEGTVQVSVRQSDHVLSNGDIVLVHPQTIHAIRQYGESSARYYNILFRFSMLENGAEDTCREKYLDPIYSRERIMPEYITPEHPLHAELEPLIRALTNDPHHQRFHDELLIKSRIFELMYRIFPTAKRQEKTLFMRTSYMKSYSAHLPFSRRTISKT